MDIETYDKYDFFNKDNHFRKYKDVKSKLLYGKKKDGAEISIVMPVYKRTEYIREALNSAIQQNTDRIYNIVVVDNTIENNLIYDIVSSFPENKILYYKNEKNIGMFGNWNRCIELAETPWVAMLHDDDRLRPDFIETIMNAIDKCPNCNGVGVELEIINDRGEVTNSKIGNGDTCLLKTTDFYLCTCPVNIEGFAFKRQLAIDIGGFDENYYPAADSNFICKLHMLYGAVYRVNNVLLQYRVAANESANPHVLCQMVLYCFTQNKALYDYIGMFYKFFYRAHQNKTIYETIKAQSIFNTEVDYRGIKEYLDFRINITVKIYMLLLKIVKPHLMQRILGKIKNKIGG